MSSWYLSTVLLQFVFSRPVLLRLVSFLLKNEALDMHVQFSRFDDEVQLTYKILVFISEHSQCCVVAGLVMANLLVKNGSLTKRPNITRVQQSTGKFNRPLHFVYFILFF
jgi:hypothetical protein